MPRGRFAFQERSRLVDEIVEHLREQIYEGRYPPGTRLLQEQIAEELDVSRTPLREAPRVLVHEGLLSLTSGNDVEVSRSSASGASMRWRCARSWTGWRPGRSRNAVRAAGWATTSDAHWDSERAALER